MNKSGIKVPTISNSESKQFIFATAHSAGQKGRGHHEAIQTVVENGDAQKYSV